MFCSLPWYDWWCWIIDKKEQQMTVFRRFMTICLTMGIMTCPLMAYSAGPDCGDGSSGGGSSNPGEFDYPANWAHLIRKLKNLKGSRSSPDA
jgi:hypothetical protein